MISVKEGDHEMIVLFGKDVAGLIILLISFIGVCGNVTIAIFTRKLPTMNNSFGLLLASQASGEAILCSGFLFWYCPIMFYENEWMIENSGSVGYIQLIAYDICVWSHLFISINRFVAICLPLRYDSIFSRRNTWKVIIFTWIVALIFETFTHYVKVFSETCQIVFVPRFWGYLFEQNELCEQLSIYVDFYKDITFVVLIGVVDLITIINVHRTNKIMSSASVSQRLRRQREISFLKQAILQMLVFVVELNTYFIWCTKFLDNRWIFWAMTSLAWVSVHTLDGVIILLLNREFRKLITSPLRKLYSLAAKESNQQLTATTPGINTPSVHA